MDGMKNKGSIQYVPQNWPDLNKIKTAVKDFIHFLYNKFKYHINLFNGQYIIFKYYFES